MKLDGIPDSVDVTHTHDVVVHVSLEVDDHTAKNIKDVGITLISAVTIGYVVRTLANFGSRIAVHLAWKIH